MIKTEELVVGDVTLVKTYSDAGYKVERDGVKYDSAVDPIDSGRVYTETDEPIDVVEEKITDAEALKIITGRGE